MIHRSVRFQLIAAAVLDANGITQTSQLMLNNDHDDLMVVHKSNKIDRSNAIRCSAASGQEVRVTSIEKRLGLVIGHFKNSFNYTDLT